MGMKPRYNEDHEYENLINEIRVEQGLTLKELASKVETHPTYMWRIAQGYEGPYHFSSGRLKDWAIKLQQVFGYDLSEIFPREVCSIENSNLTNYQLTYIAQGYEGDYYTDVETKFDRCARAEMVKDGIQKCLTAREQLVLDLRFNHNKTLKQIGDVIGIKNERVRQLEARSLRLLREYVSRIYGRSTIYKQYYNKRVSDLKRKREVAIAWSEVKVYNGSIKCTECGGDAYNGCRCPLFCIELSYVDDADLAEYLKAR